MHDGRGWQDTVVPTSSPAQRIVSLLPSGTEIICALGLSDRLVGVTHECDWPPDARNKPMVTSSVIDSEGLSAGEIDAAVRDSLEQQATIYHLDRDLLNSLKPDLIITQDLCDVCAVGQDIVRHTVSTLEFTPTVTSLEPTNLEGIFDSIWRVGVLTGTETRAANLVASLRGRLFHVGNAVAGRPIRRVLTLEWVDPIFVGGHWVPEMVQIAGGMDVLGLAGQPSREVSWEDVFASRPDYVVAMPCGFDLTRSMRELDTAALPLEWNRLPAVRAGEVYVVDGSSYFNRPGPRLIDGVEILASILHPEAIDCAPEASYARYSRVGAID